MEVTGGLLRTLAEILAKWAVRVLPQFLSRRLLPPARVAARVEIELRREYPVDISANAVVPTLSVWFEIANRGVVDVTLDRLLITELWVGQPVLYGGAILERYTIPRAGRRDDLRFAVVLTAAQVAQFKQALVDNPLAPQPVEVHLVAYFDSPAGSFSVERRLARPLRATNVPFK